MFNSLFGIVSEKKIDGVCLDCGSIEWFILMPTKDIEKLELNGQERIYVYLQHQDALMQLFGFANNKTRLAFLDLIKVNGIGPKQAVKILSNIEVSSLIEILENGNVDALRKIPGIGKVTAQKIMLSLKGKLISEKDFTETADTFKYADILTALTEMGFDKRLAKNTIEKLVAGLEKEKAEPDENEILRAAIVALSTST